MNRDQRIQLAKQTLEIIEAGAYTTADGSKVSIADTLGNCLDQTMYFLPEDLKVMAARQATLTGNEPTTIELYNETSRAGARRLVEEEEYARVGVLNFASAKNPGGGFLGGSQAQEESLARSSALYASLLLCPEYYEHHRATKSCLYTDRMIISPGCPVFMDDNGRLLDQPYYVDFITSPAPNAGAVKKNAPQETSQIPGVFTTRIEKMLALASDQQCDALVLGAWGCGVFRNDPAMVASLFAQFLKPGASYNGRFRKILFSVLDHTNDYKIYRAFENELCSAGSK